jgi:hypothetical protein
LSLSKPFGEPLLTISATIEAGDTAAAPPSVAFRLLFNCQSRPQQGKCLSMKQNLFQHLTEVSRWDLWQMELPPFAHWSHPRFGLFLLLVLTGDVVVATLAWLLVGLFIR